MSPRQEGRAERTGPAVRGTQANAQPVGDECIWSLFSHVPPYESTGVINKPNCGTDVESVHTSPSALRQGRWPVVSKSARSRRLPPAPACSSLRRRLGTAAALAGVSPASLLWTFRATFQVGVFCDVSGPEPGEGRAEGPQEVQAGRPGSHPPLGCPRLSLSTQGGVQDEPAQSRTLPSPPRPGLTGAAGAGEHRAFGFPERAQFT